MPRKPFELGDQACCWHALRTAASLAFCPSDRHDSPAEFPHTHSIPLCSKQHRLAEPWSLAWARAGTPTVGWKLVSGLVRGGAGG